MLLTVINNAIRGDNSFDGNVTNEHIRTALQKAVQAPENGYCQHSWWKETTVNDVVQTTIVNIRVDINNRPPTTAELLVPVVPPAAFDNMTSAFPESDSATQMAPPRAATQPIKTENVSIDDTFHRSASPYFDEEEPNASVAPAETTVSLYTPGAAAAVPLDNEPSPKRQRVECAAVAAADSGLVFGVSLAQLAVLPTEAFKATLEVLLANQRIQTDLEGQRMTNALEELRLTNALEERKLVSTETLSQHDVDKHRAVSQAEVAKAQVRQLELRLQLNPPAAAHPPAPRPRVPHRFAGTSLAACVERGVVPKAVFDYLMDPSNATGLLRRVLRRATKTYDLAYAADSRDQLEQLVAATVAELGRIRVTVVRDNEDVWTGTFVQLRPTPDDSVLTTEQLWDLLVPSYKQSTTLRTYEQQLLQMFVPMGHTATTILWGRTVAHADLTLLSTLSPMPTVPRATGELYVPVWDDFFMAYAGRLGFPHLASSKGNVGYLTQGTHELIQQKLSIAINDNRMH